MKNLSNLATESDECRLLLYKSMIGPFLDQIIRKPMGIIFDAAPWKEQPLFFWVRSFWLHFEIWSGFSFLTQRF